MSDLHIIKLGSKNPKHPHEVPPNEVGSSLLSKLHLKGAKEGDILHFDTWRV
jgi:hypothetical protein